MEQYIDDFQANMEKIEILDPRAFPKSQENIFCWKISRGVDQIIHLVQKCWDDSSMTFDNTVDYFG